MDKTTVSLLAVVAFLLLVLAVVVIATTRKATAEKTLSITRMLFLTTQFAALFWVSVSYGIAIYATVRLGQPFPVVELSQQAITTILGANVIKCVENIFEHNNGAVFGVTTKNE